VTIYKCDKCGQEQIHELGRVVLSNTLYGLGVYQSDLCPTCLETMRLLVVKGMMSS
jgi:hypothetical protein